MASEQAISHGAIGAIGTRDLESEAREMRRLRDPSIGERQRLLNMLSPAELRIIAGMNAPPDAPPLPMRILRLIELYQLSPEHFEDGPAKQAAQETLEFRGELQPRRCKSN